jgi:hypothetical protein
MTEGCLPHWVALAIFTAIKSHYMKAYWMTDVIDLNNLFLNI